LARGEKNLKPGGYSLTWRERGNPASCLPFRITGQGVLIDGEVKASNAEARGKPILRSLRAREEVRSPLVVGGIPEA
jgi:hypothetical protein